ncbi:MAG: hypothetical protein WAM82_29755 [Thermoanaerobaculia bacterium]
MTRSTSTAKKTAEDPARPGIEERLASLRVLLEGDEQEQRETFAFLKEALEQDRLSAQALEVDGIVATDNVGHLARFVTARTWRDIR